MSSPPRSRRASSADGTKLVAVLNGGQIYTHDGSTAVARSPSFLELTYLGGAAFFVTGAEGSIASLKLP